MPINIGSEEKVCHYITKFFRRLHVSWEVDPGFLEVHIWQGVTFQVKLIPVIHASDSDRR